MKVLSGKHTSSLGNPNHGVLRCRVMHHTCWRHIRIHRTPIDDQATSQASRPILPVSLSGGFLRSHNLRNSVRTEHPTPNINTQGKNKHIGLDIGCHRTRKVFNLETSKGSMLLSMKHVGMWSLHQHYSHCNPFSQIRTMLFAPYFPHWPYRCCSL